MINKIINFSKEQTPNLITYILDGIKNRATVLILPGGGYGYTSIREAEPIALKFNSVGMHAFVLNYTCAPNRYPQSLIDLSNAMRLINENSQEWHIDTDKIVIIGFSAGGHLAASYSLYWQEYGKYKPNAQILCYPVITTGEYTHKGSFNNLLGSQPNEDLIDKLSLEKHVTKNTPPTFIWHTVEDKVVPVENTLLFVQGLRKNNVPFELHIFPNGCHGLSLATSETAIDINPNHIVPNVSTWFELCIQWLNYLHYIN